MPHLTSLSAREASRLIAGKRLSPVDLVNAYLEKIESGDPYFQAYVEVYADDAREAAIAAEKAIRSGHRGGLLHGLPIAIKDLVEVEGRIVTAGSEHWRGRRSTRTATIVRRLIEQGAIILGKTHTVEFALGGWGTNRHMGTPRNPWDAQRARTPGGSSSGSAVAVAAGLAPWAIGTDTGGSIRVPSAWCGLTGLKSSTGRISTYGILPLSPTLDTVGPMARSVDDVALLYGVLKGPDPLDRKTRGLPDTLSGDTDVGRGVKGLRLARLADAELEGVAPEVMAAYDASLRVFEQAGADVLTVELPYRLAEVAELNALIFAVEGYALVGDLVDNPELPLDDDVRVRIQMGRDVSARDYFQALRRRESMQRDIHGLFRSFDALLTPTTETAALPLDEVDQTKAPTRFTRFANFFDLCALALPNGLSATGLPLSLQIMTGHCGEGDALRIGYAYQQMTDWHRHRPKGVPQ